MTFEREPIHEVGAEPPLGRERRQVRVRRADDAHVRPQRVRAADALEFAVLDDAQDLFLHARRNRPELIEHERPAVRLFEAADVELRGAREGPGLVAEELGLEQRFGQGRAVDLDERPVPTIREVMQTRGDELLAGAAFADDEHGLRQRRGPGDVLEHR